MTETGTGRVRPLFFFGGGILRVFRFVVLQMLEQGFDTMLHIDESGSDMDLVQIRKKVSDFLEDAHIGFG